MRFSAVAGPTAGGAELVFKYPHVVLDVDPHAPRPRPRRAPSNTDLSPSFPSGGEHDVCFDLADPRHWTAHDLVVEHASREGGSQLAITGPSPLIRSRGTLGVDI